MARRCRKDARTAHGDEMSKSKRESAIFIHDTPDEIRAKMKKAFCPPETEFNPVLDWTEHLVFQQWQGVGSQAQTGTRRRRDYQTFEELKTAYADKSLFSLDLKNALADSLIETLRPVRKHFEQPQIKAMWTNSDPCYDRRSWIPNQPVSKFNRRRISCWRQKRWSC